MLNDLTARDWIKFTKSWFVLSGKTDREKTAAHPATFPVELPQEFIRFFTRAGQCVLDPFSGTGTTMVADDSLERRSIGIELEERFADFSRTRTPSPVHIGDAAELIRDTELFPCQTVDYVFTSPPYMDALLRSRGGNLDTRHKTRQNQGQPLDYGCHIQDLGNIDDPETYVRRLTGIFQDVHQVMRPREYVTVVMQNLNINGKSLPIAWKFALQMAETGLWEPKGEKIWCQENKRLGIYGYPTAYATNNFHHYYLTFRKTEK